MLHLLQRLRALRLDGKLAEVVTFSVLFDKQEPPERGEERMARRLVMAADRRPDALVVVLTGNIHACKQVRPEVGYRTMAAFLDPEQTVSLLVRDRGGEAWNCAEDGCGSHRQRSTGGTTRGVKLRQDVDGFDGALATGMKSTASPPAVPITDLRL